MGIDKGILYVYIFIFVQVFSCSLQCQGHSECDYVPRPKIQQIKPFFNIKTMHIDICINICVMENNNNKIILGRNLFTSEGNLRGGLGSGPFMITPTRWCGNGCPQVRPHPGLRI